MPLSALRDWSKGIGNRALPGLLAISAFVLMSQDARAAADDKPADEGAVKLEAATAKISGPNARLEADKKQIVWWTAANTSLQWTAQIQKPGKYHVELDYALFGNYNGGPLVITVGKQSLDATPKAGNGASDLKTGNAGEVNIDKAGEVNVQIKPRSKIHEYVIDIRSVTLRPADKPSGGIDISGMVKPLADGTFKLLPADVLLDGMNAQLIDIGKDEKKIGFWKDVGTSLAWTLDVPKPGKYRVEMNYSQIAEEHGSKVVVKVGNQSLKVKPKATKNWTDYQTGKAGEVMIDKAGKTQVVLTPISKPHTFVMDVRSVSLLPAETSTQAADISDAPIKVPTKELLKLSASEAEIDGDAARIEGGNKKYIAWWNSADRQIKWPVKVEQPGTYRVELTYAMANDDTSDIELSIGQQKLGSSLKSSGGLDGFKTVPLGEVTIEKPDDYEVGLSSSKEVGTLVMHVDSVSLVFSHK